MKNLGEIVSILQQHRDTLCRDFRVTEVCIFGSYARGQQTERSDVDILIDYDRAPTLWMLTELRSYLSDVLKMQVDAISKNGLKPRIRERVLAEAVRI